MSRGRQPQIKPQYTPPQSREQGQTMIGDMVFTDEQINFLSTSPDLVRSFYSESIWREHWNAAEKKYIIPYTDHPITEAQECF